MSASIELPSLIKSSTQDELLAIANQASRQAIGKKVLLSPDLGLDEVELGDPRYKWPDGSEVLITARYKGVVISRPELVGATFDILAKDERLQVRAHDTPDAYSDAYCEDILAEVQERLVDPGVLCVKAYTVQRLTNPRLYGHLQ